MDSFGYDINDFNDCDYTSGYEEQRKRSKGEIEMSSTIDYYYRSLAVIHSSSNILFITNKYNDYEI
ncbi:MAG TPA: hypothetical protein VFP49_10205 [Nitrososphaeraceae archaeon]|nr:hypothetical protein [Nitrososphaeraceae archaeon]